MKLYWYPGSCSLAPHIALREAGLAFETCKVDMFTKKLEDGTDYSAVNPRGALPSLRLQNGEILTEAAVILQYIAALAPEAALMPLSGSMPRFRVLEWLNHLASDMHKGFSILFNPTAPDPFKEAVRAQLAVQFADMDRALVGSHWLAAGQYSVADIYAFVISNWASVAGVDLAPYAALAAFRARISARPAVQQALKTEGLV